MRPEILGLPARAGRSGAGVRRAQQLLLERLLSGDVESSRQVVFDRFLAGDPVARIGDELLGPVLTSIGDGWECGEVEVFQEHLAVEIVYRLIHELRDALPTVAAGSPRAIGGTVEGDIYGIPTRLVEAVLTERGFHASSLGTSLPWRAIEKAAREHEPRLLWLSASEIRDEQRFVSSVNALREQLPAAVEVVLGGRAIVQTVADRLEGITLLRQMQDLPAPS